MVGLLFFIFCIFESSNQLKMKTYQIDIEDNIFPELKRVLGFLPERCFVLYTSVRFGHTATQTVAQYW